MSSSLVEVLKSYVGTCVASANSLGQIQVRVSVPVWNNRVHKIFNAPFNITAYDSSSSAHPGDRVRVDLCHYRQHASSFRRELSAILSPYQQPLVDRPSIPSPDQRLRLWLRDDAAKLSLKEASIDRAKNAVAQMVVTRNSRLSPLVSLHYNSSQHLVRERKRLLAQQLQGRLASVHSLLSVV